jgi:hypothetical protein
VSTLIRTVGGFALLVLSAACLPNPQVAQSAELLDRLVAARAGFVVQTADATQAACDTVGDVQTRLYGEPGLTGVQPAWSSLRDAAEALQAVCGQRMLLQLATGDSAALVAARQRWQSGVQREIGVACEHLRTAAQALGRSSPCA